MTNYKKFLITDFDESDPAAKWISENTGLVFHLIHIALRRHFSGGFRPQSPEPEDCIGIAYIAVSKAMKYFNPEMASFSTYFYKVFWTVFRNEIKNDSQSLHNRNYNISYYGREKRKNPNAEINNPRGIANQNYLFDFRDQEYTGQEIAEFEFAEMAMTLYDNDRDKLFRMLTSELDKRLRGIIKDRFVNKKTLGQIGDKLGLTRERVRQLEEKALGLIGNRLVLIEKLAELFGINTERTTDAV